MKAVLNHLGTSAIYTVITGRELLELFYDMLTRLFFKKETRVDIHQLINQILFSGVDALMTITLIAVSLGTVLSMQLVDNVTNIDVTSYFGTIMALIAKEISPFLTAIVIIGRSGSGFTTFLGNMNVTREIDALKAMGIPAIDYLCIPNFLGITVSIVALNFYFTAIVMGSGLAATSLLTGRPIIILTEQIMRNFIIWDIFLITFKCLIFGSIIATISSFFGLTVKSIRIVPRAVFRTVVTSIILILMTNIIFFLCSTIIRRGLL
jgi:phospholipid/cholesterol/gamma-HCH transport system permease protein